METTRICQQCRKPVPQGAPEGLCPECLAKIALGSEPASTGPRVPPSPAILTAQFPQLEILELLGMGGMGTVYKARQPKLDRTVALKIMPIASDPAASFGERFSREARALARLNHPGIVAVYDFGQTTDFYYFIMEYVDGMNLRQLMEAGEISPREALNLVTQICTALQFAHDAHIVHRDIKPENILVNKKGHAKIADFGLAKLLGTTPDTNLTAAQTVMGTINYMAPEQRETPLEVDHRADIYSLGVVFYEMLTGEVPMGRFDPPSKKVLVDVRIDEVVLRALDREPSRRYQQASEVRTGVENIAATMKTPGAPVTPAPFPAPSKPPASLRKIILTFAAYLICALLVAAVASHSHTNGWKFLGRPLMLLAPVVLVVTVMKLAMNHHRGGLRYRDLPKGIAWRLRAKIAGLMALTGLLLFAVIMIFPIKIQETKEWLFYPKSGAYERLGLAGQFIRYNQPLGNDYYAVSEPWTLQLRLYRTGMFPALMYVTVPGLKTEFATPNQPVGTNHPVFDNNVLEEWLTNAADIHVANPQIQQETREIVELVSTYATAAPRTAEEFLHLAKADLKDFPISGFTSNSNFDGSFPVFFITLLVLLGGYFATSFWVVRTTFAKFRASLSPEQIASLEARPGGDGIGLGRSPLLYRAIVFGLITMSVLSVVAVIVHKGRVQARPFVPVVKPKSNPNPIVPVKLELVKVDSEESDAQQGYGENALNGDPATYWHTQWQGQAPGLPHEIIIQLLPRSTIRGFTYLPRQDESDHGGIKDYEFYASDEVRNFGRPIKTGAFDNSKKLKTVSLEEPVTCRFIKLKAVSEINGLQWTSAAEIGVVQDTNVTEP